jgi:hypothetical protein|tara:strand:- start:80 stop:385 length:306 start_codon:yes stop_codon:yes gene_type:complete
MSNKPNNYVKEISDITNQVKKSDVIINKNNQIKDLKESLSETLDSTNEIFKSLIKLIESNIKDEDIRLESSNIIKNSSLQFQKTLEEIQIKLSQQNVSEEE